jgi:hypothetical protein
MSAIILGVVGAYVVTSFALVSKRALKIVELHEEHQFVRSREQKAHIKAHALVLKGGFANDIKWVVHLPKKLKTAFDWLRSE